MIVEPSMDSKVFSLEADFGSQLCLNKRDHYEEPPIINSPIHRYATPKNMTLTFFSVLKYFQVHWT